MVWDSCFACFCSSTIQVFTLLFNMGINLTKLEFSSKWLKVMLPCRLGWTSCSGGGSSLMTHSAGSVTIQNCDGFWTIQVHLIFRTCHGYTFQSQLLLSNHAVCKIGLTMGLPSLLSCAHHHWSLLLAAIFKMTDFLLFSISAAWLLLYFASHNLYF